jgi:hypothetical protein
MDPLELLEENVGAECARVHQSRDDFKDGNLF